MNSAEALKYSLVTPAHNEGNYINATINSVISQTVLPISWIIVNDGSTDDTRTIVLEYVSHFPWIQLIDRPEHIERHFAAKVFAFNEGYAILKDTDFDVIGNLDADLTFDSTYFEFLLEQFSLNPRLGVAGTPFVEEGFHSFYDTSRNAKHVSGACQLFRKECFTQIGGYRPHKAGSIDWIAVTSARMLGWQTQTFLDKELEHHRPIGTSNAHALKAAFRTGQKDYFQGGHPLWEIFRVIFQMRRKPFIIKGIVLGIGFFLSWIARKKRPVSNELMKFHRKEQMEKIFSVTKDRFLPRAGQ